MRSSSGEIHEYVRIVESVREDGRVKQKVIANLGRRDTLQEVLPSLIRFLQGEDDAQKLTRESPREGPLEALDSSTWGPMLVVRHFFQQLGLWKLLDAGRRWSKLLPEEDPNDDWPSRVLALIANRLTCPTSEHGLAAWLETDYVCDRRGNRYLPHWKQQGRVRVDLVPLPRWYRTLDHLILNKDAVEVALFERLRDLFHLQPELVFYDLTSTYFEGQGPALAKHGHSRDGQPRKVQAVVGVVMVAGWPITHHVWAGNTRDSKTVEEVVKDLSKRFKFQRVVFVGDRGMVTQANLKALGEADVDSDDRRAYEERMRKKAMERVEAGLKRLQSRVAKGQLKQPEKIGAAAQRVLSRHHGHRYYDWELKDGELRYFEHPLHLSREKKYEGKYLIQTDQSDMAAVDAVAHYKELNEVERGFHTLKDPLAMRPIWHRCDRRVKAHIFVAALAFLMDRMLERALRDAGVNLSSPAAWRALQTIRHVRFRVNDAERTAVTAGSVPARQVVRALGLTDVQPPSPPQGGKASV